MAEINETVDNGVIETIEDEVEVGENFEKLDILENDKPLESKYLFITESMTLIQQVKKLTASFENLMSQIEPQDVTDPKELVKQKIDFSNDYCHLWQVLIANLTTIQKMIAEDFQRQLKETNELRLKLLDDLKNQEQTYLLQIEEIKQHSQTEIANLTAILKMQADDLQKQILKKDQLRHELLDDLKNQEQTHLLEIEKMQLQYKTELEAKDKICFELEQQIERERGEHELNVSCPICLDPWTLSGHHRLVSLSCGHLFGDPCIRSFLAQQQLCPQCRAYASENDIRLLYGRPL